jgi:hypothetical protein
MTFWLVIIAIILALILFALERGNALKAAQLDAERERLEAERELREEEMQTAEEQREYDTFFTTNGYPHRNDSARVAAWGAKRGMTYNEAHDFFLDCDVNDGISRALDESSRKRLATIRSHGWQAVYVALAFTSEQRSGHDFRPLHGMIWKDEKEKYFLNLTDLSEFGESGCSTEFPLKERSIPEGTFTIEKEQNAEWDKDAKKFKWVDMD